MKIRIYSIYAFVGLAVIAACSPDSMVVLNPDGAHVSHNFVSGVTLESLEVGDVVPGRYIVTLKESAFQSNEDARTLADQLIRQFGGQLAMRFENTIHGYVVDGLSEEAARELSHHTSVKYVEADRIVETATVQTFPGSALDRIDQRALPLDGQYVYTWTGSGDTLGGRPVDIFILDTGIDTTSNGEFTGRLGQGATCDGLHSGGQDSPTPYADVYGHGTAVASVAAGTMYGVAKRATVHSVKVSLLSNGGTSDAQLLCGVDWVAGHVTRYGITGAVANMSYNPTPGTFALRDAIQVSIGIRDIMYVKSAGNDSTDAWPGRPNRATGLLVVGATDVPDTYAHFSNHGAIVSIWAPGTGVPYYNVHLPYFMQPDTASGTSFSSPLVAGAVAMYREGHMDAASTLRSVFMTNGTQNIITGIPAPLPGSLPAGPQNNILLYTRFF